MRLTLRQTRQTLWLAATVLVIGSVACIVAATTWPYDLPQTDGPATPRVIAADHQSSPRVATASPTRHLSLDLQRPLFDPPPVKVQQAPPPPPPPLRLRLLGIVVEPDNTQAILTSGDETLHFAKVGDTIDNATIEAIEPEQVHFRYHGKQVTLSLEGQ